MGKGKKDIKPLTIPVGSHIVEETHDPEHDVMVSDNGYTSLDSISVPLGEDNSISLGETSSSCPNNTPPLKKVHDSKATSDTAGANNRNHKLFTNNHSGRNNPLLEKVDLEEESICIDAKDIEDISYVGSGLVG